MYVHILYLYIFFSPCCVYMYINICSYIHTLVVHALQSEARHARGEATRVVTAKWTQHRLDPTHGTDQRLQIA